MTANAIIREGILEVVRGVIQENSGIPNDSVEVDYRLEFNKTLLQKLQYSVVVTPIAGESNRIQVRVHAYALPDLLQEFMQSMLRTTLVTSIKPQLLQVQGESDYVMLSVFDAQIANGPIATRPQIAPAQDDLILSCAYTYQITPAA